MGSWRLSGSREPLLSCIQISWGGIPGWLSGGAPAFGPGRDAGVTGSSPESRIGLPAGSLLLPLPVSLLLFLCH